LSPIRVLLHGFSGSPRSWDAVRAHFEPTAEAIALPLLGHSPEVLSGPEVTFEDEVGRIAREIRRLGSPADLVGYSLGARVALGIMVRHPDIARRAVLVGVNPGLPDEASRTERARADERWIERLENDGIVAFVDAWEAIPLFETQRRLPPAVLKAQRRERLRHDARGLSRSLRVTGLAAMPSYWKALPALSSRISLVAGQEDAKFRTIAERVVREAPGTSFATVRDAGHNVALEEPRALARRIGEVLE
jgi:2-succinyl-6-hydroxy-2,4-cyclohexadiene-1-carboxylate synthase